MPEVGKKIFRIAIIGRPNVGKSTLFNRIVGKNIAITSKFPGTTRDQIIAPTFIGGHFSEIIDTGGIIPRAESLDLLVTEIARKTAEAADLILFVTDCKSGITNLDQEIVKILRKIATPVILVINKADQTTSAIDPEWLTLGIKNIVPISAISGKNIDGLLAIIKKNITQTEKIIISPDAIKIAIIGKPNVGKSSLINYLFGDRRVLVHHLAGTTRDSVDVLIEKDGEQFIFIDTAGIRKKQKIFLPLEELSVERAKQAIDRADICIYMTDPQEELVAQDVNLIKEIEKRGKGMILVISKWDQTKGIDKNIITKKLYCHLPDYPWLPIIFISSVTGEGINPLLENIKLINKRLDFFPVTKKISTIVQKEYQRFPGLRGKIYFIRAIKKRPLLLEAFVSDPRLFSAQFTKFLSKIIRKNFDLTGVPLKIIYKKSK